MLCYKCIKNKIHKSQIISVTKEENGEQQLFLWAYFARKLLDLVYIFERLKCLLFSKWNYLYR